MSRRPRWNHSPAFKAKVALDAIRGAALRGGSVLRTAETAATRLAR